MCFLPINHNIFFQLLYGTIIVSFATYVHSKLFLKNTDKKFIMQFLADLLALVLNVTRPDPISDHYLYYKNMQKL